MTLWDVLIMTSVGGAVGAVLSSASALGGGFLRWSIAVAIALTVGAGGAAALEGLLRAALRRSAPPRVAALRALYAVACVWLFGAGITSALIASVVLRWIG